jgi:hypothetical protein
MKANGPTLRWPLQGITLAFPIWKASRIWLLGEGEGIAIAKEVWPIAVGDCPEVQQVVKSLSIKSQQVLLFDITVRFLFSCLVDADWLDTSAYKRRLKKPPTLPDTAPPQLEPGVLLQRVLDYIGSRAGQAKEPGLAVLRREVLERALGAAELPLDCTR